MNGPRLIRLYWCSNPSHVRGDYAEETLEYVQPEDHATGHYHVAPLEVALRWYGYQPNSDVITVRRVTVDTP